MLVCSFQLGSYFLFSERRAKLSKELRAGTITFLMVSYILALNPQILGSSGGTCDAETLCEPYLYEVLGYQCLFNSESPQVLQCLNDLRMSLTTATAASSLIACFIMGFFAKLPLALAPGTGINIYMAYQVVAQGLLTYQQALVAVFLEGWIFIGLSMTGVRAGVIRYMPKSIAFASSVGIGLLLAITGLRGLGIIVFDPNTLVTLGGCESADYTYIYYSSAPVDVTSPDMITLYNVSEAGPTVYGCTGGQMRSPTMWLGLSGGILMGWLYAWGVSGSLFIGIAFVTIISWIPGHGASYLGADSSIPGGQARLDVFKEVVAAPTLSQTGLAWDWSAIGNGHFWVVLFTFLYIDLLDCTGTLLSMANLLDMKMIQDAEEAGALDDTIPQKRFLSDSREFAGQQWAFLSDGLGIVVGSMMGVSPLTVYIESAAGIEDGGRTGIVAMVVSGFFFVSLFFNPIFASIPPYATGPALIFIGALLISHADKINWDNVMDSVPAFLTIIIIPFTLSVAYGVIAGIAAYIAMRIPLWCLIIWRMAWDYKAMIMKKRSSPSRAGDGGGEDSSPDFPGGHSPHLSRHTSKAITLRQRGIHRKVFGDGEVQVVRYVTDASEDGSQHSYGRNGALEEIIAQEFVGGGFGAHQNSPSPAKGLRRSISHGSFVINPSQTATQTVMYSLGSGPRAIPTRHHRGFSSTHSSRHGSRSGSFVADSPVARTGGEGSGLGSRSLQGSQRGGVRYQDYVAGTTTQRQALSRPSSVSGALFPDVPTIPLDTEQNEEDGSFRLFGEQELLDLDLGDPSDPTEVELSFSGTGTVPRFEQKAQQTKQQTEQGEQAEQNEKSSKEISAASARPLFKETTASDRERRISSQSSRVRSLYHRSVSFSDLPRGSVDVGDSRGQLKPWPSESSFSLVPSRPAAATSYQPSLRRVESEAAARLRMLFDEAPQVLEEQPVAVLQSPFISNESPGSPDLPVRTSTRTTDQQEIDVPETIISGEIFADQRLPSRQEDGRHDHF